MRRYFEKKPVKPSMNRRAFVHDYRRPGEYMFTLFKHPDAPAFSSAAARPDCLARLAALTPASAIVLKGGRRLPPQ